MSRISKVLVVSVIASVVCAVAVSCACAASTTLLDIYEILKTQDRGSCAFSSEMRLDLPSSHDANRPPTRTTTPEKTASLFLIVIVCWCRAAARHGGLVAGRRLTTSPGEARQISATPGAFRSADPGRWLLFGHMVRGSGYLPATFPLTLAVFRPLR